MEDVITDVSATTDRPTEEASFSVLRDRCRFRCGEDHCDKGGPPKNSILARDELRLPLQHAYQPVSMIRRVG
jgi:hypothetical protein